MDSMGDTVQVIMQKAIVRSDFRAPLGVIPEAQRLPLEKAFLDFIQAKKNTDIVGLVALPGKEQRAAVGEFFNQHSDLARFKADLLAAIKAAKSPDRNAIKLVPIPATTRGDNLTGHAEHLIRIAQAKQINASGAKPPPSSLKTVRVRRL